MNKTYHLECETKNYHHFLHFQFKILMQDLISMSSKGEKSHKSLMT